MVTAFTQSQCYGEYQCLHAKLTSDQFVEIHVGAPTPNIEHACLKPSFDLDVPYLLATLVPSDLDISVTTENIITPMEFSAITQCSKIGKKCNFKSTKTHYLHFQKWQKINFCTRKKFKIAFLVVLNFFLVQKLIFCHF